MRGYDVIRELYHGNVRPCDRGFRNLTGETGNRFDELISCHNNIVDTMSYENFRTGFQLGVMIVMEAVSENETVLFEL